MSVSQYIGNGIGLLYATDPSNNIVMTETNTPKGVRSMRINGSASAPIAAERSAVGTITFTAAVVGNITAVTIAGVNQLSGNVAATSGDTAQTAIDVAANINGYTPPSGDDFTANVVGSTIYVYSTPAGGAAANGETITVSVSAGGITSTTVDFSGGSSQTGVYDSTVGLRYYINPRGNATRTSLSGAIEITKYMVVRGLQTGIISKNLSVSIGNLTGIDRSCAITQIFVDTEGGSPTDDLGFIETVDFVVGDVIRLSQRTSSRVVTIYDASTSAGNIYLTDQVSFSCEDNKSIELRLQSDATLGLIWIENGRSTSSAAVTLSRAEMLALISAGTVVNGQKYYISNVGQKGIMVTGYSNNQISDNADWFIFTPDYQNTSGDFVGQWSIFLASATINKLYAYKQNMYKSVTGAVGTAPDTDVVNWEYIPTTDTRYKSEVLSVLYSISDNQIRTARDKRGNSVYTQTAIETFKWGSNDVTYNECHVPYAYLGGIITACNLRGFVDFGNISSMINTTVNASLDVISCVKPISFTKCNIISKADVNISSTSSTGNLYTGLNIIGSYAVNITTNNGVISNSTVNTSIAPVSFIMANFNIVDSEIWYGSTLISSITGCNITPLGSNYTLSVDLTALMTGGTLTMPIGYDLAGVLNTTSASTKTITIVDYATIPSFEVTIMPQDTITTIIDTTAIASVVGNDIVSSSGNETLVGRISGSDYYTIRYSNGVWQKVNSSVNL